MIECRRLVVGANKTREPLFCSLALYNIVSRRKVSEDFCFHLNSPTEMALLSKHSPGPVDEASRSLQALFKVGVSWLRNDARRGGERRRQIPDSARIAGGGGGGECRAQRQVSAPNANIFLVLRVDKVLEGDLGAAYDRYEPD